MKINGNDCKLFLAPMAGVTDVGFRNVCASLGADVTVSEMLSARAMFHNPKKTALMTILGENEKVKEGQIFGHEEDIMAMAVKNPMLDKYDVIDINMGCPAPKIFKNGDGSALMNNMPLAFKIISACVKNSNKPVSVKFRLGVDKDISSQFGKMCEEAGASFISLHARTTQMGYSGKADYEAIASLKSKVSIPVIGNGDVVDIESYNSMLSTGVDGVMIGRGALGRPYIFSLLKGKGLPDDRYLLIEKHVELLRKYYEESWLTLYMRKHFLWYCHGIEMASSTRCELATSSDIDKSLQILKCILK